MRDLELYRLTPLFWFDHSLSNRKNLIIECQHSLEKGGSSKGQLTPLLQWGDTARRYRSPTPSTVEKGFAYPFLTHSTNTIANVNVCLYVQVKVEEAVIAPNLSLT